MSVGQDPEDILKAIQGDLAQESIIRARDALSKRLTAALFRSFNNFANIRSFRMVAKSGASVVSNKLYMQYLNWPDLLEKEGWAFPDRTVFSPEFRHKTATTMMDNVLVSAERSVDSASLVFAHSILDDVASECCEISALAGPHKWRNDVSRKMIPLQSVLEQSAESIFTNSLAEVIKQLQRESLLKKLDVLNAKCQPVPPLTVQGVPYTYDPDRLSNIDKLRQSVIHGVALNVALPMIEDDLEFLENTCRFCVFLVLVGHQLTIDGESWLKDRVATPTA